VTPLRIAVVDMGSNSLKFSVTGLDETGGPELLDTAAITVRLGQGVAATGVIAPDRIDAALAALVELEQRARALGACELIGVATAAVRMASNRQELLARIADETSWQVRVISGDEEAQLTFLGVRSDLPETGSHLIADVGGASTELVHVVDGASLFSMSVQIGSGTLADRWFSSDPPGRELVVAARHDTSNILAGIGDIDSAAGSEIHLSGGNGVFLSQVAVWSQIRVPFVVPFLPMLVERLSDVPSREVADYLGISQERARMLPAGGAVAWSLIERVGSTGLHAVQSGIGRGVAAAWFAERMDNASGAT